MGARKWHSARAAYHTEVAEHLHSATPYEDWALVAVYYAALHWLDSVLADDPDLPRDERHPKKHSGIDPGSRGRNRLISKKMPHRINRAYRDLEELSRRTRYDVDKLSDLNATAYDKVRPQLDEIATFAGMMHLTRPEIPMDAP